MANKKKRHFWHLAFIFGALIVITLVLLWSSPQGEQAGAMDSSMGNMMKQMHLTNVTIYDLLENHEQSSSMDAMHSHHQNQLPVIFKFNFLSTSIIFLLLPFIIGGTIILAVVWLK